MATRAMLAVLGIATACGIGARGAPTTPPPPMSEAMWEAGLRFHHAERDALNGRWDLVRADVAELGAVFRDEISRATHDERVDIHALARDFAASEIPPLAAAARTRDRARFETALVVVGNSCNDCHRATSNPLVELPREAPRSQTAAR